MNKVKRWILTGTPGSGKTSLIEELALLGHEVIREAATDIIALSQAEGIMEPWLEIDFIDKIIRLQKKRQIEALSGTQFYDRSPFCTYALLLYLCKLRNIDFKESFELKNEIERLLSANIYEKDVFFIENLGFIERTSARKISYEESLIFESIHRNVYRDFGFHLIHIPKESKQNRIRLILSHLR